MKLSKKEIRGIIKIFKNAQAKVISSTLSNFLCPIIENMEYIYTPKALTYLKSQKPTKKLNEEFYEHKTFDTYRDSYVWWAWEDNVEGSKALADEQRVLFLDHLIGKLKEKLN